MELPSNIQDLVTSVGTAVTSSDVDCFERVQKVNDASHRLRTVLAIWEKQQDEERRLRRGYAKWIMSGLFFEIMAATVAFFLIGGGVIHVTEWVANAFILGMFGQIATMTVIVVRYLFPNKSGSELLDAIQKL